MAGIENEEGMESGEEQERSELQQQQPVLQQPPQQPAAAAAPAAAPPQQQQSTTAPQQTKKTKKPPEHPCLTCGKNVTGASVQCTLCNLWCHKACSNITNEHFKCLEVQARETGVAFWSCRSCLNFAQKVNKQIQIYNERQIEVEEKLEETAACTKQNTNRIDKLEEELKKLRAEKEAEREEKNDALGEELRERDLRRNNLIIHGLMEDDTQANPRDRVERDKRLCGQLFQAIRTRTRAEDLRFCRRVGERGRDPRPIIIGLRSEEEKRNILERAANLRGTAFDRVSVGPDLTRMQRRAEDKLSSEAEMRNTQLTAIDIERNVRWIVVGRRGEKRLIKGTEREPNYRRPAQLGDYISTPPVPQQMQQQGQRNFRNEIETGARRKEYPQMGPQLLEPGLPNNSNYTPVQHRPAVPQPGTWQHSTTGPQPPPPYGGQQRASQPQQQQYSQPPQHSQPQQPQYSQPQQQQYSQPRQPQISQQYSQPQHPQYSQPQQQQYGQPQGNQQQQLYSQPLQQQYGQPQQQHYRSAQQTQDNGYPTQNINPQYYNNNNGYSNSYDHGNNSRARNNDSGYMEPNWTEHRQRGSDDENGQPTNGQAGATDRLTRTEEIRTSAIDGIRPRTNSKRGRTGSGPDSTEDGPPRTRSRQ
jgi:hypothetical protein